MHLAAHPRRQIDDERRRLAEQPKVPSKERVDIGLEPSVWTEVWYEAGSESGVLTLGWPANDRHGNSFVVEAMVSNPDAALAADSITDLIALSRKAFERREAR